MPATEELKVAPSLSHRFLPFGRREREAVPQARPENQPYSDVET
jgi:hypothetical protein